MGRTERDTRTEDLPHGGGSAGRWVPCSGLVKRGRWLSISATAEVECSFHRSGLDVSALFTLPAYGEPINVYLPAGCRIDARRPSGLLTDARITVSRIEGWPVLPE